MLASHNTSASAYEAILSNDGAYTVFSFDGAIIRFQTPYSVPGYTEVKKWDDGYLVVLAKYRHNAEPEEEYIDLKPVLIDKGIAPVTFLKPIKTVRIA